MVFNLYLAVSGMGRGSSSDLNARSAMISIVSSSGTLMIRFSTSSNAISFPGAHVQMRSKT